MGTSCCNPIKLNLQRGIYLEDSKTDKRFFDTPLKTSSDDFDVVDNPNGWKNNYINHEDKALFETMKCSKNRRDSFDKKWPLQIVSIDELVESGFFYLQSDDKVQCAFCKLILCSWKAGDRPMKEHIKSSPKCPFLMKVGTGKQYSTYSKEASVPTTLNANKPKHPRMIDVNMRLWTFQNFPHATIKAKDLADCGLYYTGVEDVVTCFYCGGSLSKWEPSDEPIVEHAKFYPNCNYLRIIQNRPVYKSLISHGSNNAMALQAARGSATIDQLTKDVLKSDIALRAKDIFPSSLVEEVIGQQLQEGENLSSLHYLCEKILQHEAKSFNSEKLKRALVQESSSISQPENALLCKICMDGEREVLFQPCNHLISCEKCAALITTCPVCRKHITSKLRTFLS